MAYLFGIIIFVPQEEFCEAMSFCLYFFFIIFIDQLLFKNNARKVKEVKEVKERSTTYWASFVLFWVVVGLILVSIIFYLIGLYLQELLN